MSSGGNFSSNAPVKIDKTHVGTFFSSPITVIMGVEEGWGEGSFNKERLAPAVEKA